MRKLRNFSFAEAVEWADKDYNRGYRLQLLAKTLLGESTGYSVPDSFYEPPPEGSFGKFVTCTGREYWGFRGRISTDQDGTTFYHNRDDDGFATVIFLPGLPEDVDADGMPK